MNFADEPILRSSDDYLRREAFVRRLMSSLITQRGVHDIATGVTVGLTGTWGVGKSSLLNLIEEEIETSSKNAVCVRFNPWLVGDHRELIGQYFSELIAALQSDRFVGNTYHELIDSLRLYGKVAGGVADNVFPGLGVVPAGVADWMERSVLRRSSLESMRDQVSKELEYVSFPIVVLIDELDRVEDNEVRSVARLISAVAGFPKISYVVAYDWSRVTEALGANGKGPSRGQEYLEKIIQHQIRVPPVPSFALEGFIKHELRENAVELALPDEYESEPRFARFIGAAIPGVISTLRDAKKILGSFYILRRLIRRELNWLDLLGYAAISEKHPQVRDAILAHPEYFAYDAFSVDFYNWMSSEPKPKAATDYLAAAGVDLEKLPHVSAAIDVLTFLFPDMGGVKVLGERVALPISTTRGLMLVNHYGLIDGEVSVDEVERTISADDEELRRLIFELHGSGRLSSFLNQFEDLYESLETQLRRRFWIALAVFLLDHPPGANPDSETFYIYSEAAAETLLRLLSSRRVDPMEIETVSRALISRGDINIVPQFLRQHFFVYGLFDLPRRARDIEVLSQSVIEELAMSWFERAEQTLRNGDVYFLTWSSSAVLILLEMGAMENVKLLRLGRLGIDFLRPFTCLFFRSNNVLDRDSVEKFVDFDEFIAFLQGMRADPPQDSSEFFLASVEHALSWFGIHLGDDN